MKNHDYLEAAKLLVSNMSAAEHDELLKFMNTKNQGLFESVSFQALKNSKRLFGGVGKCLSFLPIGVFIEGWYLPTNNYDAIEVFCGNTFCGNAKLGIKRQDVHQNFSFYNESNAGFSCFIEGAYFDNKTEEKIAVIVKNKGKIVTKQIIEIEHYSAQDSIKDVESCIHSSNNILIPTLTNRLEMISKIARSMPEYNFISLVEGMENKLSEVISTCKNKYKMEEEALNILSMQMVPNFLLRNQVPSVEYMACSTKIKEICQKNSVIKEASINFSTKYNVSMDYAYVYCVEAYQYAQKLLETVKPKAIMLWNQYSPWHQMIILASREYGIPVIFMENGLLPGTLIFETEGQMGESYPTTNAEEFRALQVSETEISVAAEIRKQLFKNKLNRWTSTDASVYQASELDVVKAKLIKGRPTVFYAGQNDFESGLFPYTEHTQKYHSPVFESSEDAAFYLAKLARENNWNFIYKRHPMMRGKLVANLPDNTIVSDNLDIHDAIDLADLTITILSQTSYVAMIRHKPALMLGYHQLCHKDCIYEAHKKELIEPTIIKALKEGLTEQQNRNFNKHIAQLCKYYLYADFLNKDITYGKSLNDLTKYINSVIAENDIGVLSEGRVLASEEKTGRKNTKESIKTPFYLELSKKERLERYLIKTLLKKSNPYTLLKLLNGKKIFGKVLMYIAQIDEQILSQCGWSKACQRLMSGILSNDMGNISLLLEWMEQINFNVITRLKIYENAKELLTEQLNDAEQLEKLILSCVKTSENNAQKSCFGILKEFAKSSPLETKEELRKIIRKSVSNKDVPEREKNYLFEMLHQLSLLEADDVREWNRLLMESEDKPLLYYYGVMELDRVCFVKPECRYSEYYIDRQKLLTHISDVLAAGKTWNVKPKEDNNRRLAMLVVGLHGKRFASTRLQVGIANEMAKRGWEVTIFVADTNYINSDDAFLIMPETVRRNFSKTIYQKEHWEMLDKGVNVKYFTQDENDENRYKKYLDEIYEFNPGAIIDITNEQAVYNPQLMNHFKVITVPLNGYASSSMSSAYIARNLELLKKEQENFSSVLPKCVLEANLYLPYEVEKQGYRREDKGFSKSDFLVVTVGNRLDYEITDYVKQTMKKLLVDTPNLKWIIVGRVDESGFDELRQQIQNRQVILWGYENSLSALYKMCDLYLDMPRSGGGGSTAFAVQCGLPAIILDMPSDILPFLGKETSVDNWEDALERMAELCLSRKKCRDLARKQMSNLSSKEWSVAHFAEVIELAIKQV